MVGPQAMSTLENGSPLIIYCTLKPSKFTICGSMLLAYYHVHIIISKYM